MTEDDYVKQVRQQTDTYERTIQVIVSLDSALRYDNKSHKYRPGSKSFQGRLMHTSDGTKVRPDLLVQLSNRAGIVCEIKLAASTKLDFRQAEDQIRNYDDDLHGWNTSNETIMSHDLCLAVSHAHSAAAQQYFIGVDSYDRSFALVTVTRDDQAEPFVALERRLGDFSDSTLQAKFTSVVEVPLEKLTPHWTNAKFYDAKPQCVEYTMDVLWSKYFTETDLRLRTVLKGHRQVVQKKIDPRSASQFLQEAYSVFPAAATSTGQSRIPQMRWIREALEMFVKIRRAQRDKDHTGVYWVEYSSRARTCNLEGFARQVYKTLPPPGQLVLLNETAF